MKISRICSDRPVPSDQEREARSVLRAIFFAGDRSGSCFLLSNGIDVRKPFVENEAMLTRGRRITVPGDLRRVQAC